MQKIKIKKKMIFFNEKYVCNDLQDFKIFYVFDTSLDRSKRGIKKKIDSSLNLETKEELLKKKRKRELNEKYEEREEEEEESENSDM